MTRNKVTFLLFNSRTLILFKIINLECCHAQIRIFHALNHASLVIIADTTRQWGRHLRPYPGRIYLNAGKRNYLFSSPFSSSSSFFNVFFYFHRMISYGETVVRSRFFSVLRLRLRWSTRKYAHACTRTIRRVPEGKTSSGRGKSRGCRKSINRMK